MTLRRKAILLCSFGWIPLLLYKRILNYVIKPSFLIRNVNPQVPNIEDCIDTFGYKWKCHSVRSVLCIIISSFTRMVIEMLLYVHIVS
jgi:hypothetical protein